jgi:hypothetical protein
MREDAINAGWLIVDSAPTDIKPTTTVDQPLRIPVKLGTSLERVRVLGSTPEEAFAKGFIMKPSPEPETKVNTNTEYTKGMHPVIAKASWSEYKTKDEDYEPNGPIAG